MMNQLAARGAVFDATFALLSAVIASSANLSSSVHGGNRALHVDDAQGTHIFTAASAATAHAVNERHALVARQLATIDFVALFVERCAAADAVVAAWPSLQAALRDALTRGHVASYPLLFVSCVCVCVHEMNSTMMIINFLFIALDCVLCASSKQRSICRVSRSCASRFARRRNATR